MSGKVAWRHTTGRSTAPARVFTCNSKYFPLIHADIPTDDADFGKLRGDTRQGDLLPLHVSSRAVLGKMNDQPPVVKYKGNRLILSG